MMPQPYFPPPVHQTREVDMSGLGPDPTDEYTGNSLEEFYDYLMTPRHHREGTRSGSITHYGPSRFASIRPEDAAMAEMLMKQMEMGDVRDYNQQFRKSDLARRSAADELMMPQGRGGGTMEMGGRTMDVGGAPAPQGPYDEADMIAILAGGGQADPREVAASQGLGYGGSRGGGGQGTSRTDREAYTKAKAQLTSMGRDLNDWVGREKSLRGQTLQSIINNYERNPESLADLPPNLQRAVEEFVEFGRAVTYNYPQQSGGGGVQPGGAGGGRWNSETGTIDPY